MKLSKEYIIERLQNTSVHDLAQEIAEDAKSNYPAGTLFDMESTISKFEKMLTPFAPVKATDLMQSMGVTVTEVR